MSKQITVLRVFVASPSDVANERKILEEVVRELNTTWSGTLGVMLDLIKWETHAYSSMGTDPQAVINEQIGDDYDIFIGVIWKQFGFPTVRFDSGTIEEFERAYKRFQNNPSALRIMFYFNDSPVSMSEIDPEQLGAINNFRKQLGIRGQLYWTYTDIEEFKNLVRIHLSRHVQDWQIGWGNKPTSVKISSIEDKKLADMTATTTLEQIVDEDEGEGFLDLIELGEEKFLVVQEITGRMTEALVDLGEKAQNRTDEMNEVKAVSKSSYSLKQAKRVANQAAEDLEQFVKRMDVEIPIFAEAYATATDSYARAAMLWTDFQLDDKQTMLNAQETIVGLKTSVCGAQNSMRQFRSSVASLPRLTTRFNHARRNVLQVVDHLDSEFTTAVNVTTETEKVIEKIIADIDVQDSEEKLQKPSLSNLRKNILESFNESELRDMCFELDIQYEDLPGLTRSDKVRELTTFLDRRKRIPELVELCRKLRPSQDWEGNLPHN